MKALLEDNTTGGAMPVEVKITHDEDKTRIAFRRKGLDMALTVRTDDIVEDTDDRR